METARRVCAPIVWTWLAASLLHGAAHVAVGAPLSPLPPALLGVGVAVELFFSLGPLVALALLNTRWRRWGAWLLLLTMLLALLWGFGGHFLFPSGDNVMAHLTRFAAPAFLITSILVFIMPWAGLTTSIYLLMQVPRHPAGRDPMASGSALHHREEAASPHARSLV